MATKSNPECGSKRQRDDIDANLVHAVASGNGRVVEEILSENRAHANNINVNGDGRSLLMIACGAGHHDISELLLEHGADVNAKKACNLQGTTSTALHEASKRGHLAIVKLLLKHGADVNPGGPPRSYSPLTEAAMRGHMDIVQELVTNGADVNGGGGVWSSPLVRSCYDTHTAILQYLIDQGATKAIDDALQKSTMEGYLIDEGAAVDFLEEEGEESEAVEGEWLACDDGRMTGLMMAAQQNDTKMADFFLRNGADVHLTNNISDTSLIIAAKNGSRKMVRMLLERGADINHTNNDDQSALLMAAGRNYKNIVEILLRNGADANTYGLISSSRCAFATPLFVAATRGHYESADLLVRWGSDLEATHSDSGRSPLLAAVANNQMMVAMLLLHCSANVNARASDGRAAIHFATGEGSTDNFTTQLFASNDTSMNIADKLGRSPLFSAEKGSTAEWLLRCGCCTSAKALHL